MLGRHTLKAGFEGRWVRYRNFQPSVLAGSFAFRNAQTAYPGTVRTTSGATVNGLGSTGNAFASFLLGQVQSYTYTQKDPGQTAAGDSYSGFISDDFKVTPRLTLNLGLRYELNTRLREINGIASTFDLSSGRILAGSSKPDVALDRNNFAPRFAFAYDLFGNQKTVVRGGYGVFFQPISGGGGAPIWGLPSFPFTTTSTAQSAGSTAITTLSAGPAVVPDLSLNDPRLGFGQNVGVQGPNTAPYAQQWNFVVERSLGSGFLASAGYVGTASKKTDSGRLGYINLNQVPIQTVRQAALAQNTRNPNTAGLRPYPNFNEVQLYLPRYGDSNYHSLQLKLERRFSKGFTILASYTWSKYIDNNAELFGFTGGSWPQDVYNLRAERAVSTSDVPHVFLTSMVWDLPFGENRLVPLHGFWNLLAGGWQINDITTFSSGRPVDVEQATNTSLTFSNLQRPNVTGSPVLSKDEKSINRYWNTSVFAPADPLSFGNSPRNPIRGPGRYNFDVSLVKQWRLHEQTSLEFRAKSFNFTNTPPLQLDTRVTYNPSLPLSSQSFGRITSAGDGRIIQFGMKFRF